MQDAMKKRKGDLLKNEVGGKGSHSSTFRLKVSTLCGIRCVHDFPPVY